VSRTGTVVEVGGRELKLTNLQKVMYPSVGLTKGEVIDYYVRISPFMLPHLKHRPITLKRYPDGVTGSFFYEKNCPAHRPEWVTTAGMPTPSKVLNLCVVQDLAGLVWIANLASLEIHTYLAASKNFDRPSYLAFDLDPGAPADVLDACRVGAQLRDLLGDMGLECFPKVSGSKGLHICVPLNTPVTFDAAKTFALRVARTLAQSDPKDVTANMRKDLRAGKVFVDWSQNDRHKTTVCVYSLRARERPTVSMPVSWDELAAAAKARKPERLVFEAGDAVARAEKLGDLFEPLVTLKQKLPGARSLTALAEA
jgi:bifunctional non-homologous end joining protein LigD